MNRQELTGNQNSGLIGFNLNNKLFVNWNFLGYGAAWHFFLLKLEKNRLLTNKIGNLNFATIIKF